MRPRGRKGMSLIEVMIGLAILSLVAAAIYMILLRSARQYSEGSKVGTISENGRRVLDDLSKEFREGDKTTAVPGAPVGSTPSVSTFCRFKRLTGFASGKPVFANYFIRYELGTSVVDANANGTAADDFALYRVEEAPGPSGTATAEKRQLLCHYMKPNGLTFTRTGDNTRIKLVLNVLDDRKTLLDRAVETSVTLRNAP